jgi:hypothetical protein
MDGRHTTPFNVMKPFRFDGYDHVAGAVPTVFESIDPTAGTLLLFPSWLSHSADLHTGDAARISIAFNVKLGQGPPAPPQQQQQQGRYSGSSGGRGGGNGSAQADGALPVYVPSEQCTADLCG